MFIADSDHLRVRKVPGVGMTALQYAAVTSLNDFITRVQTYAAFNLIPAAAASQLKALANQAIAVLRA